MYAPTIDAIEEETEYFYTNVQEAVRQMKRSYIQEYFIAKIGDKKELETVKRSDFGGKKRPAKWPNRYVLWTAAMKPESCGLHPVGC